MTVTALIAVCVFQAPNAFAAPSTGDLAEAGRREVVELHRFIENWSNAAAEDTDAVYARFSRALAEDFLLVGPDGSVADRQATVEGFRGAHGRWADEAGRVEVEDVRVRVVQEPYVVLTYEERHRIGDRTTGRRSTVVLRRSVEAPGGVEWVHLHEVWIAGEAPAR